jgi:hypothetical protein
MKYAIAIAGISIAFSTIASDGASAEPVLMLNEPRDVAMAEWSCRWADDEIKADEHLIKSFTCSKSELCQRALDISVACKVAGPVREVRAFHTKLLTQFASNPQCAITIMRLSGEKTPRQSTMMRKLTNEQTGSSILTSPPVPQSRHGLCGPTNPARAFLLPENLKEKVLLGR